MNRRLPIFLLAVAALPFGQATALAQNATSAQEAELQDVDYSGHFRVFTGDGTPATLDDVVRAMGEVEAVLVGETHTDPVGHWVEAELLRRALALAGAEEEAGTRRKVALSLEMFERDVQSILDEYLDDLITESQLIASARAWEHYEADYRPMVELAKAEDIPVIAANAPRRYVNRVTRLGRDALFDLSHSARSFLPPLPYPEPSDAYREEWNSLMREMPMVDQCAIPGADEDEESEREGRAMVEHPDSGQAEGVEMMRADPESPGRRMPMHGDDFMENALAAQTLWDSSMAHAVTSFLQLNPGALVLHMVGSFHVQNHTGIPEKVEFYRPGTRALVVHMELADDIGVFDPEEHGGGGDFVILTDRALDLNYERNCTGS